MNNIKKIFYPNTCPECDCCFFEVNKNCDKIKIIYKNGEMAPIAWFQIIKNQKIIAEIKESICNIYGEDVFE